MQKRIPVNLKVEDSKFIPQYATEHAAGADLRANINIPYELSPGESKLVSTGIYAEIPLGFEIQVRPRSGLALKHQITVLNTPGTIDSDYRGEVGVILINHGIKPFIIEPYMRIAQMIIAPVFQGVFVIKEQLSETARDNGGFGHSGIL